jgi:integrase/recombinase XerC
MRLSELIDDFLYYLDAIRGYSQLSVQTYEIALLQAKDRVEFYQEDVVWILDITKFRHYILENSKKTIAKKLSAIRSFVKYCQNQKNINMKLISADSIKVPQSLPKPVEQKYIEEILDECGLEDKLIISMLYALGLRISELASVKLTDIKDSWISIHGKGDKTRELPIIPSLQQTLNEYISTYMPKKYLFEKQNTPLNQAQLRYKITKLFKKHGIKVTPHQLRHSFASHLLNSGARISDVSELLGHATMATTQVYTKLEDSKKLSEYLKAHPLSQNLTQN